MPNPIKYPRQEDVLKSPGGSSLAVGIHKCLEDKGVRYQRMTDAYVRKVLQELSFLLPLRVRCMTGADGSKTDRTHAVSRFDGMNGSPAGVSLRQPARQHPGESLPTRP